MPTVHIHTLGHIIGFLVSFAGEATRVEEGRHGKTGKMSGIGVYDVKFPKHRCFKKYIKKKEIYIIQNLNLVLNQAPASKSSLK